MPVDAWGDSAQHREGRHARRSCRIHREPEAEQHPPRHDSRTGTPTVKLTPSASPPVDRALRYEVRELSAPGVHAPEQARVRRWTTAPTSFAGVSCTSSRTQAATTRERGRVSILPELATPNRDAVSMRGRPSPALREPHRRLLGGPAKGPPRLTIVSPEEILNPRPARSRWPAAPYVSLADARTLDVAPFVPFGDLATEPLAAERGRYRPPSKARRMAVAPPES